MSAPMLEQQAHEARALLADLASIGTDLDEETVATVIEGETTLAEAVAAAIVEAASAEAAATATGEMIRLLEMRRQRQAARAERIRARIAQALGSLGLRKLVTPAGSVSVVAAPARVIITDEAALPAEWWVEKVTRTPAKAAIREVLLAGTDVPGATLSNRADTIRVRT